MKLSIFSLKIEILLEFLRLGCELFHPIRADREKRIFEKVILCLNPNKARLFEGSFFLGGSLVSLEQCNVKESKKSMKIDEN